MYMYTVLHMRQKLVSNSTRQMEEMAQRINHNCAHKCSFVPNIWSYALLLIEQWNRIEKIQEPIKVSRRSNTCSFESNPLLKGLKKTNKVQQISRRCLQQPNYNVMNAS